MKKWFVVIGVVAFLLIGGYFVLTFYTVKFIQPYVQKAIRPGLTLRETKIGITHLSVRGIQYEDPHLKQQFFKVEEMRIYPSLFSFLMNSLRIREITILGASLFFYRFRLNVILLRRWVNDA